MIRTLFALVFALSMYKVILFFFPKTEAQASSAFWSQLGESSAMLPGRSAALLGHHSNPGVSANSSPRPCCPEGLEYSWCAAKEDLRSVTSFFLGVLVCWVFSGKDHDQVGASSTSGSGQRQQHQQREQRRHFPNAEKAQIYAFVM